MKKRNRSGRRIILPLTTVVGLGFGAFVALAIALVLALSVSANFRNTFSLLNDKTVLSTQALEQQLTTHFGSVENAVVGLKPYFDAGTLGFNNISRTLEDLSVALEANRDLTIVSLTDEDGRRVGVYRSPSGKIWHIDSAKPPPGLDSPELPKLTKTSPPTWGPIVVHEVGLFSNVSVPVVQNGELVGALTAASSMDDLTSIVSAHDEGLDNTVFIISSDGDLIMHSDMEAMQTGGRLEANLPMPWQTVGDPVLTAMMNETTLGEFEKAAELGVSVSIVDASEDEFIVMKAEVGGFSDKPWTIGQYYRGATVSREVQRLAGSMFVGLGALIVSVLVAFWIGRRVARPLRNLAVQSQRIGDLSLNDVEPLPRSRVAELDQVAVAFNSMVEGLKAMNTYVPRSLFIKLMRLGGGKAAEAREMDLTILFTDIVGFTAISEHMSAEETAGLLNDHFAILVEAVEAEGGTVDKFLGDGMLAFWGAPDERPDHAEAAVRTARRIAVAQREANQKAEAESRPVMRLRMGVHSGPAVVGNVGAFDRWNYTVVGDTVNAAERLQTLGREADDEPEVVILASSETINRLPGETHYRQVGTHSLRGRRGSMEVFRLDPFYNSKNSQISTESLPVTAAE
jgi:adenylate cyclase